MSKLLKIIGLCVALQSSYSMAADQSMFVQTVPPGNTVEARLAFKLDMGPGAAEGPLKKLAQSLEIAELVKSMIFGTKLRANESPETADQTFYDALKSGVTGVKALLASFEMGPERAAFEELLPRYVAALDAKKIASDLKRDFSAQLHIAVDKLVLKCIMQITGSDEKALSDQVKNVDAQSEQIVAFYTEWHVAKAAGKTLDAFVAEKKATGRVYKDEVSLERANKRAGLYSKWLKYARTTAATSANK